MFNSFSTTPSLQSTSRNAIELASKIAKQFSSMALGTRAIIRETTTVVKQVVKTLTHRKGALTTSPKEEEDGLDQPLLDGKDEYCCEHWDEIDSQISVRTKSWV